MNQLKMKLENNRDSTGRRKSLSLLAFAPKHEVVGAIVSSILCCQQLKCNLLFKEM